MQRWPFNVTLRRMHTGRKEARIVPSPTYVVWQDATHALGVGLGGVVFYTTDGAVTWSIAQSGVSVGLYGVIVVTVDLDGVTVHDGLNLGLTLFGYKWRETKGDNVANTQAVEYSYSMIDELGTKTTFLEFGLVDPGTATPTSLRAGWVALGAALDAVSGCAITGGTVRLVETPDAGFKAGPTARSRSEQTAIFNLKAAGNNRRWGVDVPGVQDTFIVAGKVDETAGATATLIKMLDGTTAWNVGQAANAAFQAITGIVDIVLSFRKHRKSLSRTSFEVVPADNA